MAELDLDSINAIIQYQVCLVTNLRLMKNINVTPSVDTEFVCKTSANIKFQGNRIGWVQYTGLKTIAWLLLL